MARGLDHIVHAVRDLQAGAALYRRLGFTVGARNRHPWGTHNHLIQLPGFFIEVLSVSEPERLGDDGFSVHFGRFNQVFTARDEGLSVLVLQSEDTNADLAAFRAAGIAASEVMSFAREGRRPDGSEVQVGFSLVFARDPASPDDARAAFAVCHQHHPENFWDESFQRHPNTVDGIAAAVLVAENPADHHIFLSAFAGERELQSTSMGVSVATPRGQIEIMDPAAFRYRFAVEPPEAGTGLRLAALRLRVREQQALIAALETGEFDFAVNQTLTVVPAPQALGATLVFEQA